VLDKRSYGAREKACGATWMTSLIDTRPRASSTPVATRWNNRRSERGATTRRRQRTRGTQAVIGGVEHTKGSGRAVEGLTSCLLSKRSTRCS
jgi:hypothetical protein